MKGCADPSCKVIGSNFSVAGRPFIVHGHHDQSPLAQNPGGGAAEMVPLETGEKPAKSSRKAKVASIVDRS